MPRHERRVRAPTHENYRRSIPQNYRLLRGWTQEAAASWYGVSVRTWQRYEEKGAPKPLLKRIETWAKNTATGAENSFWVVFRP